MMRTGISRQKFGGRELGKRSSLPCITQRHAYGGCAGLGWFLPIRVIALGSEALGAARHQSTRCSRSRKFSRAGASYP
jgi:hypothetical protein